MHAFDRMLKAREAARMSNQGVWGGTVEGVWHWWMEDSILPGQMTMWEDEQL